MASEANIPLTIQTDIGIVPEYLKDYNDPLIAWMAAPAMQCQNKSLKAFEDRLNSAGDRLTTQEKREHFHDMFMTLYAASQASGGIKGNFDFEDQANIYPPSTEAMEYLKKCKQIAPNNNQPIMIVAAVLEKLGQDAKLSKAQLRKSVKRIIDQQSQKYINGRYQTIQKDVERQGIIIDNNGEMEAFYDIAMFKEWAKESSLSGEQVGLIIAHASQGVGLGIESPLLNMQGHFHKEKGMHPGLLVKISGRKVSLQTQISGGSPMVNGNPNLYNPTTISTLKADISDFQASKYRPSLTTKPITYDYKLSLVNDKEYPRDVVAPLLNVGGKQISSEIHYKEYIENTFTALKYIKKNALVKKDKLPGERRCNYTQIGKFIEQTIPQQMHDLMHNKIIHEIQETNTQLGNGGLDLDQAVKELSAYGRSFKMSNGNELYNTPRKVMLKYAAKQGIKVYSKSVWGKVQNIVAKISIAIERNLPTKRVTNDIDILRPVPLTPTPKHKRAKGVKYTKAQTMAIVKQYKKQLQKQQPSRSGKNTRRAAGRMVKKRVATHSEMSR